MRSERGVNRGWGRRETAEDAEDAEGAEGRRKGLCPVVRAVVGLGDEVGD